MVKSKLDTVCQIVSGVLFLLLALGYIVHSALGSFTIMTVVFIAVFLIVAVGIFMERGSFPGLLLPVIGFLFHALRYGMRMIQFLPQGQRLWVGASFMFMAAFLLMALLLLSYFFNKGADRLSKVWFLPALLTVFGLIILQYRSLVAADSLSFAFWDYLFPIVSAAGLLLLGMTASEPYFLETPEEPAPAPVRRTPAPAAAPAPARKPSPAAAPTPAPVRKTAPSAAPASVRKTAPSAAPAELSPAAMEDLKLYKELLELGVITQAEFEAKRASLAGK